MKALVVNEQTIYVKSRAIIIEGNCAFNSKSVQNVGVNVWEKNENLFSDLISLSLFHLRRDTLKCILSVKSSRLFSFSKTWRVH